MKSIKTILIAATVLSLSACQVVTESGYYWGNYSHTYYQYIKEPSKEAVAAHMVSLQDIINVSQEKGLKVPPGIYAEIGYIMINSQQLEQGQSMLAKEVELYPESKTLVSGLLKD
ncbi:MAG: DUF4810 domain-containing protein [Shewanella sp.]|nr:DUF4810 domain-containing protein [Shewanella sp.]MCF1459517.1 DUF4810 domain-containing protein [Shewanella sp.]